MKWIGIAVAVVALLVILTAVIGAMLPKDHVASRSATFKRPAAELYALLADVGRRFGEDSTPEPGTVST